MVVIHIHPGSVPLWSLFTFIPVLSRYLRVFNRQIHVESSSQRSTDYACRRSPLRSINSEFALTGGWCVTCGPRWSGCWTVWTLPLAGMAAPPREEPLGLRDLLEQDFSSWDLRLRVVGLGFLFYTFIFLISHFLSHVVSVTYRSLPAKEKVFWDLALTRALFGVQGSVAGLRALTEDGALFTEKLRGQTGWSWFTVLTATGFFLFENLALHCSGLVFGSLDPALAVHHAFALAGYTGAVVGDTLGHFLPVITLLLEMSTPFTCVSWLMLKAGWSRTLFWRANQWVMIHMFHCRMVLTYYMWWVCWSHWEEMNTRVSLVSRVIFFTGLTLLTIIINPLWTHKKTMQLLSPVDWNFSDRPVPENGPRRDKPHSN
ncbi:protein CLN8 [Brachyhypopomus gauderio]|uniref:protein CLN8 n=1 Tax=Brachyhypopomus gauderio TaxID=698409 RepID=UPI004041EC43